MAFFTFVVYKDKTEEEQKTMRAKEDFYLSFKTE